MVFDSSSFEVLVAEAEELRALARNKPATSTAASAATNTAASSAKPQLSCPQRSVDVDDLVERLSTMLSVLDSSLVAQQEERRALEARLASMEVRQQRLERRMDLNAAVLTYVGRKARGH